jgi:hypothetical protein
VRAPKPHTLGVGVVMRCIFLSVETRRPLVSLGPLQADKVAR